MINKKTLLIFSIILILSYIIFNFLVIGNDRPLNFLKKNFSNETKQTIKRYIFPYSYIDKT